MSRLGEYNFLLTDLLTKEVKARVELSSFYWDEVYNSPGHALATARVDHPTTTPENWKDFATGFYAVQDGTIVWGGIVGKVQPRGGTRVISIPIIGFFEYYRNRILRGDAGMTYGNLVRTSDIEWRNVEQFHIVQDYINHAQHESFVDGDIGGEVEWDALSGVTRTSVRQQFTAKYIGIAIEEIANTLTGFDFYHTYYFDSSGRPRFRIKLRHPHRSVESSHVLLFQTERTVTQQRTILRAMELDGTGDYAHCGDVTGITGDLDLIYHIEADDWTPTSIQTIRSKWGAAGNRSWRFQLLTTGHLRLEWSEDGTAILSEDSDIANSFTDGSEGTVRVTMDVDDGGDYRVTFYESSDGGQTYTSLTTDPYESTYSVKY